MQQTILYIEDDLKIQLAVSTFLMQKEYKVLTASCGEDGMELITKQPIDLVLLDLTLPDIQGEEICAWIKSNYDLPVIMMSAKVDEDFVVNGFKLGVEDYIKKPFGLKEMLARIEAVLSKSEKRSNVLSFNNKELEINEDEYTVMLKGETLNFTQHEFQILKILAKNPNRVFSREQLIQGAFGHAYEGFERTMDSHIKNIRIKLEEDVKKPKYIATVRGVGYQFKGNEDTK